MLTSGQMGRWHVHALAQWRLPLIPAVRLRPMLAGAPGLVAAAAGGRPSGAAVAPAATGTARGRA